MIDQRTNWLFPNKNKDNCNARSEYIKDFFLKNAIRYDKAQQAKFRGRPLFRATKQHLNNS